MSSTMMVLMVLTMMVMTTGAFSFHHVHSRTALTYQRIDTNALAATRGSSSSSSSSQPQRQPRKGPPRQGGYQNGNTQNRRPGNNNDNKRNHRRGPRDPRVAKWIATNRQILDCHSGSEVLSVLSSTPDALTKMAGGGALSVVNMSTSIHRISRSASRDKRERQAILSDPRYALLLCSATEAWIGMDCSKPLSALKDDAIGNSHSPVTFDFDSRGLANIAWALAKMEILPPANSFPLYRDTTGSHRDMRLRCFELRSLVLKNRDDPRAWISSLSALSAMLFDSVACEMQNVQDSDKISSQNLSNLLYSFATSQRHDEELFESFSPTLLRLFGEEDSEAKPQEFSNVIWSYATAEVRGARQVELISLLADTMESRPGFVGSMKGQELANTAWALAKLMVQSEEHHDNNKSRHDERSTMETTVNTIQHRDLSVVCILRQVAMAMIDRPGDFYPQGISNSVWAMGTVGFGVGNDSQQGEQGMSGTTLLQSDDMWNDRKLVLAALDSVAKSSIPRLSRFNSQNLSNLAWGFAKLGQCDHELFHEISVALSSQRRPPNSQVVANTLWAFATVGYNDVDDFLRVLSLVNGSSINGFNSQEMSNICWAIGTAGIEPRFPNAFDVTITPLKGQPSNQAIGSDPVTLFFGFAAADVMRRPQAYNSQEVANLLWAFSTAGVRHPDLFRSIAEHLVGSAHRDGANGKGPIGHALLRFNDQDVSNLLWSYGQQSQLAGDGTSSTRSVAFLEDIGERLLKRLCSVCVQHLWERNDGRLDSVDILHLSQVAWSLAVLGIHDRGFFDAIEAQTIKRASNSRRQEIFEGRRLSNLVWASATLNRRNTELLDTITPYAVRMCQDRHSGETTPKSINKYFDQQAIGNLLWSCGVMDHFPPDLMRLLYRGIVGEGAEQQLDFMSRFHQDTGLQVGCFGSLLYAHEAMDQTGKLNGLELPPDFIDGWFKSDDAVQLRPSKLQSSVSRAMNRIGVDHKEEYLVPIQGTKLLALDLALPDQKVGIEVDGPSHFIHNMDEWSVDQKTQPNDELNWSWTTQEMNGSTAMKDRLLEKKGWTIVHIPFWEWNRVQGKTAAEDEYLRSVLPME